MRILLFILLVVSCGKSHDGKSGNTPRPEEREEGQITIRYNAVAVEKNCGFWTDCDFMVRAEFNQRPIILNSHFVNNSLPDEIGKCDFEVTLSEAEALQLEKLADKLRICKVRNNPTFDRGFDGLFITDRNGKENLVYKYKDGGQEENGRVNYLCAGREAYYQYLRSLVEPAAPPECPDSYKRLFQ